MRRALAILLFLVAGAPVGSKAKTLASDGFTTCAVTNGGLQCWGANEYGQLGQGDKNSRRLPTYVPGMGPNSGVTAVSVGGQQVCAVKAGGIWCWGLDPVAKYSLDSYDDSAQFSRLSPQSLIPAGNGAVEIAVGSYHACAVIGATVTCWGVSYDGALGSENGVLTTPTVVPNVTVKPKIGVASIAAGGSTTCALMDGGVTCWGQDLLAPFGNSSSLPTSLPGYAPGDLSHPDVVDIGVGDILGCAALMTGATICWGYGSDLYGSLGDGGGQGSGPNLVKDAAFSDAIVSGTKSISVGNAMACAVHQSGAVRCWGLSEVPGGIGDGGDDALAAKASLVAGIAGSVEVVASGFGGCIRTLTGVIKCWGSKQFGALGNGDDSITRVPTVSPLLFGVSSLGTGPQHTCATVGGGAECWGWGGNGRLGASVSGDLLVPGWVTNLAGGSGVAEVGAGDAHSCELSTDATLRCWGRGVEGQLGAGVYLSTIQPQQVPGSWSGLTVGHGHTCAANAAGLHCWGASLHGQLGNNGISMGKPTPQQVARDSVGTPLGSVTAARAGGAHTCAIKAGEAWCWGANSSGQLGYDTGGAAQSFAKKAVGLPAGSLVTLLAAGSDHTCATVVDPSFQNSVWCWGGNSSGQSGSGTPHVPRKILDGAVAQLIAGSAFTCARYQGSAGTVCWGDNEYGQLGNGSFADSATPTPVLFPAGTVAQLLSIGPVARHACAVTNNGVFCWGDGSHGQLANNTPGVALTVTGEALLNFSNGFE